MSIGQLAEFTRISKYAQRVGDGRETHEEQVERVFGMHDTFYGERLDDIWGNFELAKQAMTDKVILGSMRNAQFAGPSVLKKHERSYNCCGSFCDRTRFFQECYFLLLCGCGTGFSVQKHHVTRLPDIHHRHVGTAIPHVVTDSIEGWADALGILLNSFFDPDGYIATFDFSEVRPRGAPISGGFVAPGPGPLKQALIDIERVIESRLASGEHRLHPIDAYDIVMYAAASVLSGGVRRSSTVCIFSHDDEEMMNAKTGQSWWRVNPQRQLSNNSALLLRGSTTFQQFEKLIKRTREYGEPGFLWSDSTEIVANPCLEILFYPVWEMPSGVKLSGWQFCNLTSISAPACKTEQDFYAACYDAAFVGTLQAGYTRFPYLGPITEMITRKEALLGVSITGMMENPKILTPEILKDGADIVVMANEAIAKKLGINPAARATCIKPEGTGSLALGVVSQGIHASHSRRGVRHIRVNVNEVPYKFYRTMNPHAENRLPHTDPESATTRVLAFPYEVPADAVVKDDLTAVEFLEMVKMIQKSWIAPGRIGPDDKPWLSHNVSNTVVVEDHEWTDVTQSIYDNRASFVGVSLLPSVGDKKYRLAPWVSVHTPEEQTEMFGTDLASRALEIARTYPSGSSDIWETMDEIESGNGFISRPDRMTEWKSAIYVLGIHYNDDQAMMAIKEAIWWLRYNELLEKTVDVDWSQMVDDSADKMAGTMEPACAGGVCMLSF